jgi:hypothetical protein
MGIHKRDFITIRSGWPVTYQKKYKEEKWDIEYTMKSDLEHFNITTYQLDYDTRMNGERISHQRISQIMNCVGRTADMGELNILTVSFNRILAKRDLIDENIRAFEENFLSDNQ